MVLEYNLSLSHNAVILVFLLFTWLSDPESGTSGIIFFSLVIIQWLYRKYNKRARSTPSPNHIQIENRNILYFGKGGIKMNCATYKKPFFSILKVDIIASYFSEACM
jgi:hypothetical protein